MNEEEIKDLIKQAIDQNSTSNQYAVSDIPFHTHIGTDSHQLKFINALSDAPKSYYKQKGRSLIVNPTETGLEFSGAVLATTATDGFLIIPSCNGTPTGTPSAGVGSMILDTSANKLWIWNGSAWKYSSLT